MKLQDTFFSLIREENTPESRNYTLRLHPEHSIYQNHFPGNPVTPGVCMIQIVKELAEAACGTKLFLFQASKIRYYKVINPIEYPVVQLSMTLTPAEGNTCQVSATLFSENDRFTQIAALFRPA